MELTTAETARYLANVDDALILAHENPDGDACGSAYALCKGLRRLGKRAAVKLEKLPEMNKFMDDGYALDFEPRYVIAVDTSDRSILGASAAGLTKDCRVDLNIDHHASNSFFAENTCLGASKAAASMLVHEILRLMDVEITKDIAECLYVALATDTGCFRYPNTTAEVFAEAASLAEKGIDVGEINKIQFETVTRSFLSLERMALDNIVFGSDGRLAVLPVTHDMLQKSGAEETELQGLVALPKQVEGVLIAATLKERSPGVFKVSFRTNKGIDAQKAAKRFGGGGHKAAAGCTVSGTLDEVQNAVFAVMNDVLEEYCPS